MSVQIFHNPRCSKCRITLHMLQEEQKIKPEIILYLTTPPSTEELAAILQKLGMEAKALVRFNEDIAKKLKIKATDERTEAEWLTIMVENPILIERPIVIHGDKAAIGRPPAHVLKLFEEA